MNSAQIFVGNQLQPIDPGFAGQRFQPHRLPDAAGWRVPDAARFADLLASRLRAGVGRVPDRNHDFLRVGRLQHSGNVEAESVVSAAMAADLPAIDENRGLLIHRAKAQNHTFLGPALGHRESAPVPEAILVADRLHHTRESRLNRKRHEDFLIIAGLGGIGISSVG